MLWYQGGIANAVADSKKKGAIFVVYVEGQDEKSLEFTRLIDGEDISTVLQSNNFVAIKVEANSVPHQQFSQIYKQVAVPSIFFIGKTGAPLEVITDAQSSSELLNQIDKIVKQSGIINESNNDQANQSKVFITSEQTGGLVCSHAENKPSTSENVTPAAPTDNANSNTSTEDKIERAKELIEKKRQEKQAEEEEKERNKEIERRKMGQDVQKLQRKQQDQELKLIMENRDKEKKEQQAARQRVLDQIAQDKAERASKFSSPPTVQQSLQTSPKPVHRLPVNNNIARLQFRLPDGSSHTHEFSSASLLQDVRNYISENLNLPFQNFTLSTTFPRREFTISDNSANLLDLELVPNAVILILPLVSGTVATNSGTLTSMFWTIIASFLGIFSYLKRKMFGPTVPSTSSQEKKRPAESTDEPSSSAQKRRIGETSAVRRQGNIHRLNDNKDSDDENNTWNGNSTQQM